MNKTLFLLFFAFAVNLNATNSNSTPQDRDDLTLAVSYTTYDYDQNIMQIIFANQNDAKISYKIFNRVLVRYSCFLVGKPRWHPSSRL